MMIYSMTGYGKGTVIEGDTIVEAEIKSLNSRFLDLSIRLPRTISDKEYEVRELIKKKLTRGKVNLFVSVKKNANGQKMEYFDLSGIKEAIKILKGVKKETKLKGKISLDNVLAFQQLYSIEPILDPVKEYDMSINAINLALEQFLNMRTKEGEELKKDLDSRVNNIKNIVLIIEQGSEKDRNDYFAKLIERAKQLMSSIGEYDDRLKLELALIAERYDTTEECVRLKSHIKLFESILKDGNEAGRRLNFLIQEMNREANTINSKSISSEISHLGITIKEDLEKIREQIQNIE
ncbi:MAG: YicC/YloC family endoribonuclease [bacterium]